MYKFYEYLSEAAEQPEGKALKHLTHLEDLPIHGGNDGASTAADFLDSVHNSLSGKKSTTHLSTKYDGAPSVVFGKHPKTGQFFVATKSAFNKTPKINYTPEDIDANHGHAPGLAAKLKEALQHLPKVMPKQGGVYQGDLMFGQGDVQSKGGKHSFTPNTITYSTDKDSAEGRAIGKAKLGMVVHTEYKGGGDLGNMTAGPLNDKTRSTFASHSDVANIDPTVKPDPNNYSPEERAEFHGHKQKAEMTYKRMKPEALDALSGHGTMLEAHVNDMIRNGGTPSVDGYVAHLSKRATKDFESVKTPASKDKKARAHSAAIEHIMNNREHFEKALQLHGHLQAAKNVLTRVMAKSNPFEHSIRGIPTAPEGAVAVDKKGNSAKFVDREEFSRQNFNRNEGGFQ
jgi:hypothetical protein